MPVVSAEEKTSILAYITASHESTAPRRAPKAYRKRCGSCHAAPEASELDPEQWEQRIAVLDGAMPVFSSAERAAILRYFKRYGRGADETQTEIGERRGSPLAMRLPVDSKPAPAFTLSSLSNGEVSIADYRGKVVLLHFWATWCESCREELPSLAKLGHWLGNDEFAVVAVAIDHKRQAVHEFVDSVEDDLTVLLDEEGKVRNAYLVSALPTTYVVGKDGKLIGLIEGPRDWSDQASRDHIRALARR